MWLHFKKTHYVLIIRIFRENSIHVHWAQGCSLWPTPSLWLQLIPLMLNIIDSVAVLLHDAHFQCFKLTLLFLVCVVRMQSHSRHAPNLQKKCNTIFVNKALRKLANVYKIWKNFMELTLWPIHRKKKFINILWTVKRNSFTWDVFNKIRSDKCRY